MVEEISEKACTRIPILMEFVKIIIHGQRSDDNNNN